MHCTVSISDQNGLWIFFNLNTKAYVRRTQWTKLPTNKLVIAVMNELAGVSGIKVVDLELPEQEDEAMMPEQAGPPLHAPNPEQLPLEMTEQEAAIEFEEGLKMPDLVDQGGDDDSVSESSDSDDEDDDAMSKSDPDEEERFEKELEAMEQQAAELETDDSGSSTPKDNKGVHLHRSTRETAGVRRYDDNYEWNLMNLSVGAAIRNFGDSAHEACKAELIQLFKVKKALTPVKWDSLTLEQRKIVVRSHMFLREKYEDGKIVKLKGRIVADGRMQDRSVFTDYSPPTAKTRSIMTCLKLAAVQNWDLLKVDVGGAFLCASIDGTEEVFMIIDETLTEMAKEHMPEVAKFVREDGKLVVRVDKAMYGLIQPAKLWYKELTRFLQENGFKKCPSDEFVLVKHVEGKGAIVVILYIDDILIMSKDTVDRYWVKEILERQYERITVTEGPRLPYLGMTLLKTQDGFKISMQSYIEDAIKLYEKKLTEYVTPTKANSFKVDASAAHIKEKARFHSMVAKLLYLGKRGHPDILLPVQFLCTQVKAPTVEDERKLERVLGYLQLTMYWTKVFDQSSFA
jgi:hypothetical protein